MPKPKYDHPIILKGAVQIFAHLAQKPTSADLQKVTNECRCPCGQLCTVEGRWTKLA